MRLLRFLFIVYVLPVPCLDVVAQRAPVPAMTAAADRWTPLYVVPSEGESDPWVGAVRGAAAGTVIGILTTTMVNTRRKEQGRPGIVHSPIPWCIVGGATVGFLLTKPRGRRRTTF